MAPGLRRDQRRIAHDLREHLQCGLPDGEGSVSVSGHFVSTASQRNRQVSAHTSIQPEEENTHAPKMRTYENVPAFLKSPVTCPLTV